MILIIKSLCLDIGKEPEQAETGGYHSVGLSYENLDEFTVQKNNDPEPVFHPAFPVPDILSQNLVSIPLVFLICQCTISRPGYYCLFDS